MEYPDGTYMAPTATLDDQLGGLLLPMLGHSLFLAIPLVAFILMRQRPSLRHRCPHVTVIMSLGNALIGAWACLRLAVNPTVVRVPCLVESWLLGLGVPFWFLGLAGRWVYTFRISQSHQRYLGLSFSSRSHDNASICPSAAETDHTNGISEVSGSGSGSGSGGSSHNFSQMARLIASPDHRIALWIYGVFSLHLIVLAFFSLYGGGDITTLWVAECLDHWANLVWLVAGLVYLILPLPFLTRRFARMDEAHRIRQEYFIVLSLTSLFLFLGTFFAALPGMPGESRHLWYSVVVEMYLLSTYTATVILPLWRSGRPIPLATEVTLSSFLAFLEDPVGLEEFKEFCSKDFSIENAVFYERIRAVIHAYPEILEGRGRRRLRRIYDFHLAPSSPLTVNLTDGIVGRLRTPLRDPRAKGPPLLDDLQEALGEVVNLMYQSTYPRFIAYKAQSKMASLA